ncbi:LPS export ABC transporter periplasmic protein LptC [Caulobacter sp. NIBR2454]|uniref:LPS export ABC transporter periplasmic protein LptC n=1 Tax=Caulobacter sp. NIBR2454 TaxID=3015996 RepID=UPI0022B73A91|nr:LPS export ABC transporter periplasmic protein LptC [Caulobacter sp. NIBR2454]
MTQAAALTDRPSRPDLKRWRKRSRTVRTLRWALPAAAGLLVVMLGAQIVWNAFARETPSLEKAATVVRMTNPRFFGRDEKGRPFRISAKSAARDDKDINVILLEQPDVSLAMDGPSATRATARTGIYRESDRTLKLQGDVKFSDASGYRFAAQEANVDTRAGRVVGQGPVRGEGPGTQLNANGYTVEDKGDRVIFRGRVRARLNQD